MAELMDLSPGSLIASFLVSTAGFGLFMYGKKQTRAPQILSGIAMMLTPYLVDGPIQMFGAASAIGIGVWVALRVGA